jgi:inositol-hexakisphosphate kinase
MSNPSPEQGQGVKNVASPSKPRPATSSAEEQPRIVSRSQQANQNDDLPRVYFNINRHIIPEDFLTHRPSPVHSFSDRGPLQRQGSTQSDITPLTTTQPPTPAPIGSCWGTTIVNSQLRDQIMRDVFSPTTIHRHTSKRGTRQLIRTDTDPNVHATTSKPIKIHSKATTHARAASSFDERKLVAGPSSRDRPTLSTLSNELAQDVAAESDRSSTSGNTDSPAPRRSRTPRRRASTAALRRRQSDVDSQSRGALQFWDDENYTGDAEEEVFAMDDPDSRPTSSASSHTDEHIEEEFEDTTPRQAVQDAPLDSLPNGMLPSAALASVQSNPDSPLIPLNPKEARLAAGQRSEEYLMLEDLTAGLKHPCTLDLKMGTRQYGIEANEKKQKSQRQKCKTTTSRQLGLRVCGMQTYDVKQNRYHWQDKYYGRDLKAGKDFQDALTSFFYNGVNHSAARRLIPQALEEIDQLERVVRGLPGYRFYGSSLYIIYDGASELDNRTTTDAAPPTRGRTDAEGQTVISSSTTNSGGGAVAVKKNKDFLFKVIDFANCVTAETTPLAGAASPPHRPNDIDRGYVRGLRTLRQYFRRIYREMGEREEREGREKGKGGVAVGTERHEEGTGGEGVLVEEVRVDGDEDVSE